jgi:hypothetical protein
MLFLGFISTASLPAIGFFDEHSYPHIHFTLAFLFFGSVALYAFVLAHAMSTYKMRFPVSQWPEIKLLNILKWVILAAELTMLYAIINIDTMLWLVTLSEWITTIMSLTYMCFLSFTNSYYDSVHAYDSPVALSLPYA